MKISAIIPAAGTGSRYSSKKNKLLEKLGGCPVIIHTLNEISEVDYINEIIICASCELLDEITLLVKKHNVKKIKKIIHGGQTRQESVFNGLCELKQNIVPDYFLIHDGARPFVDKKIINDTINTAVEKGAAISAIPVKDTIKKINITKGEVIETINREEIWQVQTPQVFKFSEILEAHNTFKNEIFTDDSALVEKMGFKVFIAQGSYKNIKITTTEDFKISEALFTPISK